MTFERVAGRRLATGIIVGLDEQILRAPDGREVRRDVVVHPGGVGILAFDGSRVMLVHQYRAGAGRWVLEIPAGKRDRPDEDPAELARRELREEVGLEATSVVSLGTMLPSPAYVSEIIHLFLATGLTPVGRTPDGVEEDHAEPVWMDAEEALAKARRGELEDAKTVVALLRWNGGTDRPG